MLINLLSNRLINTWLLSKSFRPSILVLNKSHFIFKKTINAIKHWIKVVLLRRSFKKISNIKDRFTFKILKESQEKFQLRVVVVVTFW